MIRHLAHIARPELNGRDCGCVYHELLIGPVERGRCLNAWHERAVAKLSLRIATGHLQRFYQGQPLSRLLIVCDVGDCGQEHTVGETEWQLFKNRFNTGII